MYRSTDFLLNQSQKELLSIMTAALFCNGRFFTFVHDSLKSLLHVNFVKIIKNLLSRQFV